VTDFDFVAEGKGSVILGVDNEGNAHGVDSDHIVVMASGLVLFKSEHGIEVAFGVQAVITEPIWSVLEVSATRRSPEPPPICDRCEDDPVTIATMHPPCCPKCGRTA